MISTLRAPPPDYAANLRRLMAREGLTMAELMRRTRLNHRTLKGMLAGNRRPQARTLHRLAASLNVPVEELFQDPALLRHRLFDRQTNPAVEEIVASHPHLFHAWTAAEFDELYSRFGTGGSLMPEGTLEVVHAMNRRRELLAKVTLLLETSEAEFLESMIELLHRRAVIAAPKSEDAGQLRGSAQNSNLVSDASRPAVGDAKLIGGAAGDIPARPFIDQQQA